MLSPGQIERFYENHAGEVLSYLARRCPDGAAHDLLQETFLHVVRQAGRLESVSMPRAWLLGTARHILARYYRSRATSIENAAPQLPAHAVSEDARMPAVREAIASLPSELRETLELRLEQELSYEEIAGVLEIPIGTVRSRLHGAVRQLRATLLSQERLL